MKKLTIVLITILTLISLTSCKDTGNVENKKYSITFEENGGTQIEDIYDIEKGSTVNMPSITRLGYTFEGWYTSKSFIKGTEVTNETQIGKNIKVYAKWKALRYNVKINLDGGTMDCEYSDGNNGVDYGTEVILPTPEKTGYLFEGWYIENQEFDGKLVVTENVEISTKWIDISTLEAKYNLKLNLNGGSLYLYNDKEELMEEFFADYSTFRKMEIDSTNFWEVSHNNIIGKNGFFGNEEYFNKWKFLLEYLSTTAREENREVMRKIAENEDLTSEDMNRLRSVIRNEILAFFLNIERVVSGWGSIVSGNYSKEELQTGYLKYCKIEAPTEYVTGEGIDLKEPIKEGYIFLGWYDNLEFDGGTYTEIDKNEYGDYEFYALWGKVE